MEVELLLYLLLHQPIRWFAIPTWQDLEEPGRVAEYGGSYVCPNSLTCWKWAQRVQSVAASLHLPSPCLGQSCTPHSTGCRWTIVLVNPWCTWARGGITELQYSISVCVCVCVCYHAKNYAIHLQVQSKVPVDKKWSTRFVDFFVQKLWC